MPEQTSEQQKIEKAYFAGGCFWCTEAIFQRLQGVTKVTSGYMGGKTQNPSYEDVHAGSGHAETVEMEFDPALIPYERLVEVFFATHDPTTINRQGPDVGAEYRSAIFFVSPEQEQIALAVKRQLETVHAFDRPIVTEILPATRFFSAEPEHQNFYNRDPEQTYCQYVINPKLQKLREKFLPYLKQENP